MLVLLNVITEPSNVRKKKGEEAIGCDKSTIICDINTVQCDDGTVKC